MIDPEEVNQTVVGPSAPARSRVGRQQRRARQRGASSVEYIIICSLIAVAGVVAWRAFGDSIVTKVTAAQGEVDGL